MPFWHFFRMGWDGHALLGRPSRIPHRNWKNIFVLGADEYIEILEGKIRECLFFYLKIIYSRITVWVATHNGVISLLRQHCYFAFVSILFLNIYDKINHMDTSLCSCLAFQSDSDPSNDEWNACAIKAKKNTNHGQQTTYAKGLNVCNA